MLSKAVILQEPKGRGFRADADGFTVGVETADRHGPPVFPADRECEGCSTPLSIYNPLERCALCEVDATSPPPLRRAWCPTCEDEATLNDKGYCLWCGLKVLLKRKRAPNRILKRAVKVEERDEESGEVISSRVSNKQLRHDIDGADATATVIARYVAEGVPVGVEGKGGARLRPEAFSALAAALIGLRG